MKTLLSIMTHADADETFRRHLPIWREHLTEGAELLFWSPADASVKVEGFPCQFVCNAQHDGTQAIFRFRYIMDHMAKMGGYDRFGFLEYDSFIHGRLPAQNSEIAGNVFTDENQDGRWMGTLFIHPPFLVDASALRKIVDVMNRIPITADQMMWDRQFGFAVQQSGVTVSNWIASGYGYSQNTIHPAHHEALQKAILNGAHAIHGCKSKECFDVVKGAWAIRRQIDNLEERGFNVCRR